MTGNSSRILATAAAALALLIGGGWGTWKAWSVWSAPDRMLVGVHATSSGDPIVMYRYDGTESLEYRFGRYDQATGSMAWEASLGARALAVYPGNGMSVASGVAVVAEDMENPKGLESRVTAYDVDTAKMLWEHSFEHKHRVPVAVSGTESTIHLHDNGHVEVLKRDTGTVLYAGPHNRHRLPGYGDRWLALDSGSEHTWVDLHSGSAMVMGDYNGDTCVVGNRVYGWSDKGLLMFDLMTQEFNSLQGWPNDDSGWDGAPRAWTCGFRHMGDSLRLVFTQQIRDGAVLIGVNIQGEQAELAWSKTLKNGSLHVGGAHQGVQNRLDLAWFGEIPRFVVTEMDVPEAPTFGDDRRLVVIDTDTGTVVSKGPAVRLPYAIFKEGGDLLVRASEQFRVDEDDGEVGLLFLVDGATGEVVSALRGSTIWTTPRSVREEQRWIWQQSSFSQEHDLHIHPMRRDLKAKHPPMAVTMGDESIAEARKLLGQ